MKRTLTAAVICIQALTAFSQSTWKPVPGRITTPWTDKVTASKPHDEYPRPQLVRSQWKNLNGLWNYAIVDKNAAKPEKYDGNILVPFCAESSLSGVGKSVKPDQKLWYQTTFTVPSTWKSKQLLLHFDAVDWETTVWLNGKKVGEHRGGSDPFTFDITPYLTAQSSQELVVSVWDPTDTGTQPRGKQMLNPKGIWYTPVTGIWQTVWLEPVAKTHITAVLPVADIDRNRITINNKIAGLTGNEQVRVTVTKDKKRVAQQVFAANKVAEVAIPNAQLWTPDKPELYHLDIELIRGSQSLDKVSSYFAMRKISVGKDDLGYERLLLNNKPLFEYGTLDQGWWPDGLLTPPTDEAMRYDMDVLKSMGFNMLRKHIKVEPSRYYYYADSVGLLIWQDMVTGFESVKSDVQHIKPEAAEDWQRPKESAVQFEKEWKSIIDHLRFFPSIVVWVTFNEGWGQYDTKRIVEWTQKYDPSRVVDGVSGWTDRKVGAMNDAHHYPGPGMEPAEQNPGKVMVLGEFGGLGLPIQGHLWNPGMRNWGYRTYKTKDELIKQYKDLIHNLYPMTGHGLAAAVYTQTTDVEGEVNGLITYDRRQIKIEPSLMRSLHAPLFQQPKRTWVIVPDSEVSAHSMLHTNVDPGGNGQPDLSKFKTVNGTLDLKKGEQGWFAKTFSLTDIPKGIQLRLVTSGDVKIWLNGKLVVDKMVNAKRHYDEINLSEYVGQLKKGNNQLVAEVKNVMTPNEFDMGMYAF
ncbi:beta-galactosidase (plasmid) [Pedobacter sp. BS3]|uniref:glycoside hydrolase family 2 protein n=1 Tax=Pedobacter sp. BS3 TaxID=2567937 RepID=UPI0011ED46EE|nr:sugar-binding domain-containing protein [Pedobacter sp. BS3]TZF86485.1 beta-galactosidase [Pedobacter sp. BS3]